MPVSGLNGITTRSQKDIEQTEPVPYRGVPGVIRTMISSESLCGSFFGLRILRACMSGEA